MNSAHVPRRSLLDESYHWRCIPVLRNEVLRGGQTLAINDIGQAVGGYTTIASNSVNNLSSIVVPQNVSLNAIGFNASSPLNVSGSVNVLGSLFALQHEANVVSVLQLGNLNIAPGGLLSGILPTGIESRLIT